jgi:hypothetical protein
MKLIENIEKCIKVYYIHANNYFNIIIYLKKGSSCLTRIATKLLYMHLVWKF